jgi:anti-sigma B factor antagonist
MSIHFEVEDIRLRVTVNEVDHHTVDSFAAELAEGLRRYEDMPRPSPGRCTTSMIVDLSDVTFLDSSGLRALIDADITAMRFGGRVVIVGARGIVRRCLEVSGVLDHMQHPAERWSET